MDKIAEIRARYATIRKEANERFLRIWAATEAQSIGYGGVTIISEATGIARSRINRGKKEILSGSRPDGIRVRKKGAGKKIIRTDRP